MSKINTGKRVAMRDGRRAYIVADNLCGDRLGVVVVDDNVKYLRTYPASGIWVASNYDSPDDLVNISENFLYDGWINVYHSGGHFMNSRDSVWNSKEQADSHASPDRVACIHVQQAFLEGEGL